MIPDSLKTLIREPLLHFVLIGAALFVLFELADDGSPAATDKRIVVSAGRIEQLTNIFSRTWQRPPTDQELEGLIDDFVLEEVYYRQAIAMGIDRDDTVIRRRLRQKLEFLTDDVAAASVPSEQELTAYLTANGESFRQDSSYSFQQVYISPDQPGDDFDRRIAELLAGLRSGDIEPGDGGLLPAALDGMPARAIDASFGAGFAAKLDELPIGQWQGPIESGLGLHLVRLESRVEGMLPALDDVRQIVEREWANEKRLETRRAINEALLAEYELAIEWPSTGSGDSAATP